MKLKGKTALVTGGGRDIGRACAIRLAKEGANVAINYHSSSAGAESAVSEIASAGGVAFAMQGDMTKVEDVDALVKATVESFGDVDYLIHVTGGLVARKTLPELDPEHWQTVMDLNATSCCMQSEQYFHICRLAGRSFRSPHKQPVMVVVPVR